MNTFSRVVWVAALLAVVGIFAYSRQDGRRSDERAGRVAARAQSASGAFVVADTWRSLPNVRPPDAWSQAAGIERTPDGRIFVADGDPADPRVTVLDPNGGARTLPTAGHLRQPVHLAADPGIDRLYVADIGLGALVVFTLAGAHVETRPDIPGAYGVAVGPDGIVYVTASQTGEVHRFARDGRRLPPWKEIVPMVDGGSLLTGVAVDSVGLVHLLDGRSATIHLRDRSGSSKGDTEVPLGAKLIDVAIVGQGDKQVHWFATSHGLAWMDHNGTLTTNALVGSLTSVAADQAADLVAVASAPFARGVSQVATLGLAAQMSGRGDPQVTWRGGLLTAVGYLNGPERIEVGADGAAYIVDRFPRVQRFSRQGQPLRQMRVAFPLAFDAGADGRLYFVDGDRLYARDFVAPDLDGAEGWQTSLVAGGVPDAFVSEVALDSSRTPAELVALDITARTVRRYDLAGKPVGPPVSLRLQPGDADMWHDMALAPDGKVFVLNRTTRVVRTVTPEGTLGTISVKTPAHRLAIGKDGTLLALTRDGLVWHYDAAGTLLDVFDARRADLSPVSRPTDLAVDTDGAIFVTDRNADAVTRFVWDPNATPPDPPPTETVCRTSLDKTAAPPSVLLGARVDVELKVRGDCGTTVIPPPLDIFLVIDNSGSMLENRKMEISRQAALDFVHAMDLSQSRIGVATFNHQGGLATGLTSEEGRLWRAINGITPFGGTAIDQGLRHGREAWLADRRPAVRTVFILLSDGKSDEAAAKAEADLLKAEGVGLFTISLDADVLLMRDLATDATYAYDTKDPNFLFGIFGAIVQRITAGVLFRTIEIVDQLPANMRYVDGSAAPPPLRYDPASRTLTWSFTNVSFAGLDLRYQVEPQEPGDWPTNVVAWADYVDGYSKAARPEFPIPHVQVAAQTATPTPTYTPTPTPTPTPAPVYMPLALREECVPGQRYTDAILVIDTSGSMEGAKFAAAKNAALTFVRMMRFQPDANGWRDQVAIVSFNTQARLVTELTSDQARIEAAINGLTLANGTWIDRGLQVALDEMQSGRRRFGNTPTIILMTDGIYSGDQPESVLLALGDRICGQKFRLYTIGLGGDVKMQFLSDLACESSMAFQAPTPEELAGIYTQIAGSIPCAPETFWGGR